MISGRRGLLRASILPSALLAAGLGLTMGGCRTMPDPLPDSFDAVHIPRLKPGSKAEAEAFKKRVRNDPFPAAGSVLGASSPSPKSGSP